jgi:two-component sensor histidine kinase
VPRVCPSWRAIGDELLALLDGRPHFEMETVRRTLAGQPLHVRVQVTGLPAARVIVSMVDITASKQAERALREAVARQEVLLREIHHRVKNNLAVIASLFYLSSTHTDDARVVALLDDSRRRIRSMSLVHETLYGSDNLARIDMAQYTRILANEVMAAYRPLSANVQLTCELQPVSLSVDLAVPCGLILNELVSNAFKHAFPDGRAGVVHVSLQELTRPGTGLTAGPTASCACPMMGSVCRRTWTSPRTTRWGCAWFVCSPGSCAPSWRSSATVHERRPA